LLESDVAQSGRTGDWRVHALAVDASMAVTGAFRCLENMAELLGEEAAITLVLPRGSRIRPCDSQAFAGIVYLPIVSLRKSVISMILYVPMLLWCGWRLAAFARKTKASCLIINDFYLMQGAVARIFGYRGRLISWVRIDPVRYPRWLRRAWLGCTFRASDCVVAVSEFIRNRLPPSQKTVRIYDSVPLVPQPMRPASQNNSEDNPSVVFVGNYTPGKGQDHAVSAFAQIAHEFPSARLHFHGGDFGMEKNRGFRRELEARVEQLGLSQRVAFHGFTEQVEEAYGTAAVALNLSISESFSLTCLEASTFGLPIIAFRSGGPEEIIADGQTGFLCPTGDIEAVANALRRLLRDPDLRSRMGSAGVQRAEQVFGSQQFLEAIRPLLLLADSHGSSLLPRGVQSERNISTNRGA
jgi:glycosyltransferase involved in cell wall biosynthesis